MRAVVWPSALSPDDVLIVAFSLEPSGDPGVMRSLLDPVERARADRFVRDTDRTRFIVAHAVTRAMLGGCLGVPPQSIAFGTGHFGKPHVLQPSEDLRFNLSHTANRALLALSRGREIGVDIEQERPVDVLGLAAHCFSPGERTALASFPEHERLHAFYRGWTRKESFVKAHGVGLSFPLQQFDVSLDDAGENLLLNDEVSAPPHDTWTIRALSCTPGFCAAVTVAGTGWQLVSCELSSADGSLFEPASVTNRP